MKRSTILLCALFSGILLFSCSETVGIEEDTTPIPEAATAYAEAHNTRSGADPEPTFEEVKKYLEQCGYDTATLTECDDCYLLYGELGFSKEWLTEALASPSTRMAYTQLLEKQYYRLYLDLRWENDMSVFQPFTEAVAEWNNIENCCIDFSSAHNEGTTRGIRMDVPVIIAERYMGQPLTGFIHVEIMNTGSIGKVTINTGSERWKKIDSTQKKYAVMHALGLLVGCDYYSFGGRDYPGTMSDPNSIMQNSSGLDTNPNLWQGFTMFDILALQTMYPLKPATYGMSCQPEIADDKMVVGTQYTLTPSYEYAGC